MATTKNIRRAEFGDFQTPPELARSVCSLLAPRCFPRSIVEPTCGIGNLLIAALEEFPSEAAVGADINAKYLTILSDRLQNHSACRNVRLVHDSFFRVNWKELIASLPEPILVIGNPPWVTNSQLASFGSDNLPAKSNFHDYDGLEALTGKSNFDISEWMLTKLLQFLAGRDATLAMLCKTAVARKVLVQAWKHGYGPADAEIRAIDAKKHFDAAVDACLFVCSTNSTPASHGCRIFSDLDAAQPSSSIGFCDNMLIADPAAYERTKQFAGTEVYKWRSGVKHDCSKVMEFQLKSNGYQNGLGESVDLEDRYLFPMLKSSELATGRIVVALRRMLVTQRRVADETSFIRDDAPKTWNYLQRHGELLDARASAIYKGRSRFSVFGIGDYTFAPWKVAISGFYKRLQFAVVGNVEGTPIVLDDTAYFVACQTEEEAAFVAGLLNSTAAHEFYASLIFWDTKRPITIEILKRLDLSKVAREYGTEDRLRAYVARSVKQDAAQQSQLFATD